jgi:hypothetical protein
MGLEQIEGLANCLQKYRETAKITERERAYTTDIEEQKSGKCS